MAPLTIRDIVRAVPRASTCGPAELRDLALVVAPRIARHGTPHADVVRLAAALIVHGAGEDLGAYGLTLTPEEIERASDAARELTAPAEDAEGGRSRLAERERDELREALTVEREARAAVERERDELREKLAIATSAPAESKAGAKAKAEKKD